MSTYIFDIDGTVCSKVKKNSDCRYVRPYKNRIKEINRLYDKGNKIIFFTSRGYVTGIDWTDVTIKQLNLWGVKYHQLIFGKPFGDYYVGDEAINDKAFFGLK